MRLHFCRGQLYVRAVLSSISPCLIFHNTLRSQLPNPNIWVHCGKFAVPHGYRNPRFGHQRCNHLTIFSKCFEAEKRGQGLLSGSCMLTRWTQAALHHSNLRASKQHSLLRNDKNRTINNLFLYPTFQTVSTPFPWKETADVYPRNSHWHQSPRLSNVLIPERCQTKCPSYFAHPVFPAGGLANMHQRLFHQKLTGSGPGWPPCRFTFSLCIEHRSETNRVLSCDSILWPTWINRRSTEKSRCISFKLQRR